MDGETQSGVVLAMPDTWRNDRRLSFAARGILASLATVPHAHAPAWPSVDEILAMSLDDPGIVRCALRELDLAGYYWADPGLLSLPSMSVPRRDPGQVVYYLRRPNGDIKIGKASSADPRIRNGLKERIYRISEPGETLELLAFEPGYDTLERLRHLEFSACRVAPTGEWFRPSSALLRHVACVARTHSTEHNGIAAR
jgi:hypothetical protein